MRVKEICAIALAGAAIAPAAAHAGFVGYSAGAQNDPYAIMSYYDLLGTETNDVVVSMSGVTGKVVERNALVLPDPFSALSVLTHCSLGLGQATCTGNLGFLIYAVSLGGGNDRARVASNSPSDSSHLSVYGSNGRDRIIGSPDDDVLGGGADNDFIDGGAGDDLINVSFSESPPLGTRDGSDTLRGGDGVDRIGARDGVADDVACGAGDDTAIVDSLDVVAADCEHVFVGSP